MTNIDSSTMTEADDSGAAPVLDPEVLEALKIIGEHADELEKVARATRGIDSEVRGTFAVLNDLAEATQGLTAQELAALTEIATALETVSTVENQAEQLAAAQQGVENLQQFVDESRSADERMEAVRATSKLLRELNRETYDALEYE